jgi:hypothetical protein
LQRCVFETAGEIAVKPQSGAIPPHLPSGADAPQATTVLKPVLEQSPPHVSFGVSASSAPSQLKSNGSVPGSGLVIGNVW